MADTTVKMKVLVTADTTQADQAAERARKKIQAAYRAENSGARAQGQASEDSGMSRGIGGLTGAAGRDFAKQAQGLGGLVHVYATFAANIFAVSAAFNALSNAMDTTNMIKGLDQLGAASGTSLGTLSKRLVQVTDGAVSMRQAMEATAKASSSGMSSENIIRMGKVAKQASQALGVDMADAVSRLSRGITKLEPELLDELGIFTKIDPAVRKYADSVGKSVTALTDFERRMAFTNAVLEEGEKKFNSIDIDTNPYTKLLAALKDAGQGILSFINKGSGLVNFLAESPAALTAGIVGLTTMLVKMAIPSLGQFKEKYQEIAKISADLAAKKAGDARTAKDSIKASVLAEVGRIAEDKVDAVDRAEEKLLALTNSSISTRTKAYALLKKQVTEVSELELAEVDRIAAREQKKGNTQTADAYREVTKTIREAQVAEKEYAAVHDATEKKLMSGDLKRTVEANYQAQVNSVKAGMLANAAYNSSLIGVTGSWALFRAEVSNSGLEISRFNRLSLLTKGALAVLAGQLEKVANAFNRIFIAFTVVTTAYGILQGIFGTAAKEASNLSSALDAVDGAGDNLKRTFDAISKKPLIEQVNTSSISAQANAYRELAEGVSSVVDAYDAFNKKASAFEKGVDALKSITPLMQSNSQALAKNLSSSLEQALVKVGSGANADKLRENISKILSIDPKFTQAQLDAALNKGIKSPEILKQLVKTLQDVSKEASISAAKGLEMDEAFKKTAENRNKLINSFAPQDNLTNYGNSLIDQFNKLSVALNDPEQKLNALNSLSKQMMETPGTDISTAMGLKKLAEDANKAAEATARLSQLEKQREEVRAKADKLFFGRGKEFVETGGKINGATPYSGSTRFNAQVKELADELRYIDSQKELNVKVKTEVSSTLAEGSELARKAVEQGLTAAAGIVASRLAVEWAKAGNAAKEAYISIMSGTAAGVKMQADLERQNINAQIAQIDVQKSLILATEELNLTIQKKSLEDFKSTGFNENAAAARYKEIDKRQKAIEDKEAVISGAKGSGGSTYANLINKNKDNMASIDPSALKLAESMDSMNASKAALGSQKIAIAVKEKVGLIGVESAKTQELIQADKERLDNTAKSLSNMKAYVGESNLAYLAAVDANEQDRLQLDYIEKILPLIKKITEYRLIAEGTDKNITVAGRAEARERIQQLSNQIASQYISKREKETILGINSALAKSNIEYQKQKTIKERAFELDSLNRAAISSDIQHQSALLELSKTNGDITEAEYLSRKNQLEINTSLAKLADDTNKINYDYSTKLAELEKQRSDAAMALGMFSEAYADKNKEIEASEAHILALKEAQVSAAQDQVNKASELREINLKIAQEADWKKFKEGLVDALTSALEEGFKNGENSATTLVKFLQNSLNGLVVKPLIKAGSETMLDMVGLGNGKGIENLTKQFDNITRVFKTDIGANIENGLQDGLNAISNNISRDLGGNLELGVAGFKAGIDKFGTSVNEFFGGTKIFKGGTNSMLQAVGYIDAASDIFSGKRIGEGIGKGLGTYFGSGNPIATMIGGEIGKWVDKFFGGGGYVKSVTSVWSNFNKEGMLESSSRGYDYTPDQDKKTEQQLKLISAKYQNLAEMLSVATVKFGVGLSVNDSDGGKYEFRSIYGDSGKEYRTGEQAYSAEGVTAAATRSILLAIKESELPKALSGIFDGVDIKSLDQASLDNFIKKLVQFSSIAKDLGELGIPVLNDLSYTSLEALAELSGGIDKFSANVSGYLANFYTEEENIARARKNISKVLISAGAINSEDALPKTREGFRALVDSFQETTPEALKAVNALMQVQGAFAEIVPAAEDLIKRLTDAELLTARRDQDIRILELLGNKEEALRLTREKELSTMDGRIKLAQLLIYALEDAKARAEGTFDQQVKILTLLKDSEAALILTRQKELASLDAALRPAQKYIYALEDQAKAQSKVKTIFDKLTSSIKNTAAQIKSLDDAINAMKLGGESTATPLEKYEEAKTQLDALKQIIATNTGSDQASIDARNDALSKLPSATSKVLEFSKVLFASSEQYTKDFNEMLSILSGNKTALESQKSLEEQTVDTLKSSNSFLETIDTNIADLPAALAALLSANQKVDSTKSGMFDSGRANSIATYIRTLEWGNAATEKQSAESVYKAAQQYGVSQMEIANAMNLPYNDVVKFFDAYGIPAFAKGGYASGLSLVGEKGPELVDFKSPGRVYSNTSSNDMFANANKELVAEVRALRQEVAKLREEQKEQTGHIIATNYDANARAAGTITESVETSTADMAWANRSQVKIA